MLLDDFMRNSAERFPSKTACVWGGNRFTYAQLDADINRFANALLEAGIEPGDRVIVFLENRIETIVSIFGILRAGGAFVVVNTTTKPDKLCFVLNDCAARALVLPGRAKPALDAVEPAVDTLRCVVTCGPTARREGQRGLVYLDFDRDLPQFSAAAPPQRCIDMDLAALIYTSGTTGKPKGVTMTHLNMISAANSITEYLENVPDDIILDVLPLSFDYGLYQALMSVRMGATLVLETSFAYPYQIIQRVRDERVTGFPGVPTIYAILLQMKDLDPGHFDTVRYVTNTAAALPPAHIARLRGMFRNARIYSMYGITECKRVSFLPPAELERRPTSVGRGMPNEQVSVVNDQGRPVTPGEVGELVVRGPNVMQGYWNRPEETARALRPGKYPWEKVLYTGDLFTVDDEGYLYFVSRKDDIIKSRGEKVSPREVEDVISELPDVREVAVLGVPDEILGQAVKAVVVKAQGAALTEKDILGHCTRRLESFMVPKYIEFRDSLPKTDSGKIRRARLKEEA